MNDFAKATDEYRRETGQKQVTLAGVNFDKFINKIPYLRKTLPIKYDALGRLMYEESAFESFLFGGRVKTDASNKVVNEIYRLRDADEKPNIKDLRFSYSKKVTKLKEKVGQERFYELSRAFGEKMAVVYEQTINSGNYKRMKNDEDKKKELNKVADEEYNKLMKRYNIK